MAVGTLTIACRATTAEARGNLNALRGDLRRMPADAAAASVGMLQLEASMRRTGNTAAEFQRKFAASQQRGRIGGSEIDLSGDVGRYAGIGRLSEGAARGTTAFRTLGTAMRTVATITRVLSFVGTVAAIGTVVVAAIRGKKAWLELGQSVMKMTGIDAIVDRALGVEQIEQRSKDLDKRLKEFHERRKKVEDERRRFNESLGSAVADAQRGGIVARFGEEAARMREDSAQFGAAGAVRLMTERRETARFEEQAAAERKRHEEQIAAIRRRDQIAEQARVAAQRNRREDAKTIRDLEKEAADFWKSDARRRRDDTLGNIEDPRQRARAKFALERLEAAEAVKRDREAKLEDASAVRGRGGAEALDARTMEGWQALRDSVRGGGPQQQILNVNKQQLAKLDAIATAVTARRDVDIFDPFDGR
jgi:hypothetical protein